MMANWEKLNKEFDDILNNISDDDWHDWYNNLDAQKEMHKMQLSLEAKLQSEKLNFRNILGNLIINETLTSDSVVETSKIVMSNDFYNYENNTKVKGNTNYPLAA